MPLSADQIGFFHDQGYLLVEGLIPPGDLQPVIAELDREIDWRARRLVAKGELSRPYEECGFETRLARISAETDKIAVSIWNGILHGPAIFDLISHPRLVDVAEQLCGSAEIVASSVYRLRPKIPNYGYGAVPWHQDSGYFEPYCDNVADPHRLAAAGRCHRGERLHVGHSRLPSPARRPPSPQPQRQLPGDRGADLPPGQRVCCPLRKGGALLITNRTIHGSFLNRTEIVRWSMDLRYQSAALPTNAADHTAAGRERALGRDRRAGRLFSAGPRFSRPLAGPARRSDADLRAVPPASRESHPPAGHQPFRRHVGRAKDRGILKVLESDLQAACRHVTLASDPP